MAFKNNRWQALLAAISLCLVLPSQAQIFDGTQNVIIDERQSTDGACSTYAADIDGDGDMDVLSASSFDSKIAWYENTDGKGTFATQQVISTLAFGALSVYAIDLDGDGDMDVLSASFDDAKIAWYENTDGMGTFSAQKIISTSADGASSVYATDIDGDGDMDVLSASRDDDKIAWYENTDGRGTFSTQKIISTLANGARSVFAADIDGDGDMDVLSASKFDDKIAWYENTDGLGTFSAQQVISTLTNVARSVYAADLDGDGDMDVLSASIDDDKIAWYENSDGRGTFAAEQVISTAASGAASVYATDLDGDGDMDVLSASRFDAKIAYYENTDGKGTFAAQQVTSTAAAGAASVYASDVDGDMDVLSASSFDDKIAWYENLTFTVGITYNDQKDNTLSWQNTGLGLALENTVSVKSHVYIYNTQGQRLHATQLSGNSSQHIDLPAGIYLLSVENAGQLTRFKALVY